MSAAERDVVGALRVALKERDRLRQENARLLGGSSEPIAIVGMACRYPGGVSSPKQLWALLAEGRDAIGGFPDDRGWDLEGIYDPDPDTLGTSYTRAGGFLYDAGDFDPEFFGIAPREALATDPQQRQLLEACWEGLEDAGLPPAALQGSQTGVFAGISSQDYQAQDSEFEGYGVTGSSTSVLSGRVAYTLGLEGPAMTIDTACSSSLVAMHLAAQALRGGECTLALAGGVTVVALPNPFIDFSRQRGLAPDGRCKSFAESADGTGFSEGVGMLVLERLSDAQRNGHKVLATIKGSAVNQDGASNGLTAPNGPSQERVIRQALANAGLSPQDIDAVEAHGTGTTLGDPIEAGALLATYGQERERPLKLGSIKSNIGHTQAAAGVAGVIKTVMAMREGVLPKTLHIDSPSSKVEWEAGEIELLSEAEPWEPNGRPRRAGVSSFGISGTNAHLILEEAPALSEAEPGEGDGEGQDATTAPLPGPIPFALSAKSEVALKEQASRLAAHLQANPELDPTDVAYSLATTRSSFEYRAVALGTDREQLLERLGALASGAQGAGLCRGRAADEQAPALLFGGQGSQHPAMALGLLESSAAFAHHIEECEQALDPHVEWSLREVLREEQGEWLDRLDIVQPALFAVMVSLAKLWREMGVRPSLVAGHSQGEIAAAHIAGGLSLDDAALVIARRAQAMTKIAGKGGMLSVSLAPDQLRGRLEPFGERLSLAAINGPASLVVSGEPEALAELRGGCEQDGVHSKPIAVDYAAHSAQIEDLREELLEAFAPISPRSGEIPLHSTVTGEPIDTARLDAEYWYRNLRQTVLLEPVFGSLLQGGQRAFIEVSPHPVLGFGLQEAIDAQPEAQEAAIVPTLRREEGGPERFALSLAEAHANGIEVNWETFFATSGAKAVSLPTYAFQRERYWIAGSAGAQDVGSIGQGDPEHPLLGAMIEDPAGEGLTFTGSLSLATHPWLADHAIGDTVLLPGTAFLELALHVGELAGAAAVEELTLMAPLIIPRAGAIGLQVSVGEPGEDGERSISIHSRAEADPGEEPQWVQNASGTLGEAPSAAAEPLGAWPPKAAQPLDLDDLYGRLADGGLEYGPAFQGLRAAWQDGEDVYAEVSLAAEQAGEAASFGIHPALLDAALHAIALSAPGGDLRLPFAWSEARLCAAGASELRVAIRPDGKDGLSLAIADAQGEPIATIGSLAVRPVDPAALGRASDDSEGLFELDWSEVESLGVAAEAELCELGPASPAQSTAPTRVALEAIQKWLSLDQEAERRLAILTHGALAIGEEESPDPALAAAWGLVRSAQAEHPGRFLLIDSDGSETSEQALAKVLESDGEPQLALREGVALAPRLTRLDAGPDGPLALDPERTVLITGATGGLGSLVARHIAAEHGARHLLLVGRSGPRAEGAEALRSELEEHGAEVRIAACDVSDRSQLEELLASIPAEHPLGAVVHAAGALDDGVIDSLDEERIERVFAPKANAAWHLHELTKAMDLSAFVMFSSAAGVLGAPGQGNYAAANAFLDALAQERRTEELPASSIAWGLWERRSALTAGLGEADLARMSRAGIEALSEQRGLALFDAALAVASPATVALGLNRAGLRSQAAAGALPAIMSGLVRVSARRRAAAASSLAKTLASTPEAGREALVLAMVRAEVAAVLGHGSGEAIEPTRAFKDLGFDSLAAVELRNRLQLATGLRLPATTVFDYPSSAALAAHLLEAVSADGASKEVAVRAQASEEPIAIVGMACRYPGGASTPERLWELLSEGRDAIGGFPDDRGWDLERIYDPDPDTPGTSYTREGGFLYDAGDFDPEFFGIAPREATAMDPQQRLLLEASWEALESAGIAAGSLRGSPAGVFAGMMNPDYGARLARIPAVLEGYYGVGIAASVLSGRVAYTLGLEGPAMTVDTACSSSLVAMHLAAGSLRSGECTLALAGGVTVLSTPGAFIDFSRQRGFAPDGRCKSFSEAADGVGWAEGAGMLVLERLSDAQRNGHKVLATIKGSAVNQDGASNGLTAPNGPSQERVIRQALANAGLEARDIDAVEAHGTGTTLGDPIEAGALLATYGQERERPLKLGSIKSNIGHTQAAAGVAGVIKTVMAMREGVLPKTLHIDSPSSKVEWEAGEIELLSEAEPWEPNGRPRRAGVSSFGISGTNAHLILEEAPALSEAEPGEGDGEGQDATTAPLPGPIPFALSAKSEVALKEQASRLAAHLQANPELDPTDVAYSLATTRSSFEYRAVALGTDREQLLERLGALGAGAESPGIARGRAGAGRDPVFLFPGQGSQWRGMALELLDTSPAFARHMEECEQALSPFLDFSVRDVLAGAEQAPAIERIEVVQPVLFAVTTSLASLWRACGVRPAAVAGHSQGEIAAAYIAGGLSLGDAAMLAAVRSQVISKLAGKGAMVSVALPADRLSSRIERWGDRVEVAAINGPSSTILAAEGEAVGELLEQCEAEGVRAREVPATIASHSAQVEVLREELLEALAPISPRSGEIPFHSTVTGGLLDTAELDAAYWYRNLRQTVLFEQVTRGLLAEGHRTLIEISPHPVFAFALGETIEATVPDPAGALALGTLRREEGGPERFALSLAEAHANGIEVNWETFFATSGAKAVSLPTYAFQRERYWIAGSAGAQDVGSIGQGDPEHPLLGAMIEDPAGEGLTFTGSLSLATHPWLADHAIGDTVLLPGTAFLELALHVGELAGAAAVEELTLMAPLIIPRAGAIGLQVSVGEPGEDGERSISIHSRAEADPGEEPQWVQNASGTLGEAPSAAAEPLGAWPPKAAQPLDLDDLYGRLADGGLEYGPAFQGLRAAWQDGEDVYAEVSLAAEQAGEAASFGIHPALLDAALHAIALSAPGGDLRLPFAWSEARLCAAGASELRVAIRPDGKDGLSLAIADAQGEPIATIGSLAVRPVDPAALGRASDDSEGLFELDWSEVESLGVAAEAELCELGPASPAQSTAPTRVALEAIQKWLSLDQEAERRLAILTHGALAIGEEESPDPALAAAWGLVRSAQAEHPGRFLLIDSDGSETSEQALAKVLESDGEPQLALREGVALAPRLTRLDAGPDGPLALDPERTVLITGATGGLGSLVARHIAAEHGARHLLLVGRSGPRAEGAEALRSELEEHGAEVRIAACDVSDRSQLEELLASIPAEHPLGAVVHAAGALDDGVIDSLDEERIERVFAPKANAAWHLHELTKAMDLSAFVMFSSAAGVLGAPGQGNYAAANAFLDALAQERRTEELPASSIAWGLWERRSALTAGLGEADLARMSRAGIEALSEQRGLALFDAALAVASPATVALGLNRAGLRSQAAAGALPAIMSGLVRVSARRRAAAASSLAKTLASTPEAGREALVLAMVRAEVAAVLGHGSGEAIEPTRAFKDLGFDSLAAVELRNRLQLATGLRLPATTVFDYPSSAALAAHLLEAVSADGASKEVAVRAQASEEPIAIVGMACRYPGGASTPERLWELLSEGRDAIGGFPDDRGWDLERIYDPDPDTPGTSYTREGGFLYDAGDFDPEFFGIAPREATAMDPQQRLLLEASWEALESAGIAAGSLKGKPAGVFTGISSQDYTVALRGAERTLEGFLATGSLTSVVSGRIAYTLGLEGPAMTVDTACSSSLVAMHLAAQALRSGECTLALAGGATVLSTTGAFTEFSRQRGLAPDGRCKSFAEAADGVGWAEGAGMLVLERLSDAQRNGHKVLATIKGSAVNQDGASNGLTAPNGPSQERVIRQALANAGLEARDIDAVEAHGTGTTLGDPIEAGALLATYGQERERPLKLGSIKSNIGHTQAAAGVAGVIKTVMAMREGVLPKTLHIDSPSSKVEWEAGEIELLSEAEPWEPNGRPRRAGVSSFGISGTNAHLILEEAPALSEAEPGEGDGEGQDATTAPLPGPIPFALSAKSEVALKEQASRLAAHLQANPELDPTDVAYSLATTRSSFEYRAVALGTDREQLLERLGALGRAEPVAGTIAARASSPAKLAYLFTGQGSQRVGMGKELYDAYPPYTETFDGACAHFDQELKEPLKEIVFGTHSQAEELLEHTSYAQPALFVTELALYRLLESWGLVPELLCGHSIGEITAAHIAGVFELPDAARLVAARGRLMGELPKGGAMVAIEATEAEAAEAIAGKEQELAIAAINGPRSVVLSGAAGAIEAAEAEWQEQGRKTKRLAVSHAFHSPLIEPMLEHFELAARALTYSEPQIQIVSNLTGELLNPKQATDPAYWVSHVREPVRFADAVGSLADQGASALVELGPDPVLIAMARECLAGEDGQQLAFAAALREGYEEPETLSAALATAHAAGIEVDWETFFAATGAKAVELPTYAFQRERYWLSAAAAAGDAVAIGLGDAGHPLLSAVVEDPVGDGAILAGRVSLQSHPWLADHAVFGAVLFPGTGLLELALRAGWQVGAGNVEELTLQAPLVLPGAAAAQIQVGVSGSEDDGRREVSIHSRREGEAGEWTCHALGVLTPLPPAAPAPQEAWPPPGAEAIGVGDLYERLDDLGFTYGPAFQGLTAAWRDGEELYAEVSLPEKWAGEARRFVIHPALADAALHALLHGLPMGESGAEELPLPFVWRDVHVASTGAASLRLRIAPGADGYGLTATDGTGALVAQVGAVVSRPAQRSQIEASLSGAQSLYRLRWDEIDVPTAAAPLAVAILGEAKIAGLDGKRHGALAALVESGEAPDLVLADFRHSPREGDLAEASRAVATRALELLQAWLEAGSLEGSSLVFLTEDALCTAGQEDPDLAAAALCGLVRSAQSEHPGRFALIDVDGSGASFEQIESALAVTAEEPQVALREGAVLVPRLAQVEAAEPDRRPLLADPASTVLITGGTGGIGALLARHLVVEHGARRLLLLSRRGPDAENAEALRDELEALGAEVRIAACDVAEREQLKELLDSIPAEHPLGAVIHAAGVLDDGVIGSLDAGRIERVFAPKATAAWHLHELTAAAELSAFILFSSAAGALGGPGQGNYAAANAFLDALAQRRQARGLPASALAWGAWEPVGGMTEALASADRARLARMGLMPIRVEQGLGLFDLALSDGAPLLAPVAFDRGALRAQARAGALPALLRGLVRLPTRAESGTGALLERLAALPEAEREAILLEVVRGHVAAVLGHASSHQVDPDRPFKELGFDSLAAVELRNQLAVATGLRLEPTVVFDYPTTADVAAHLLRELGLGVAEEAEAPVERPGQISADVVLASVEEIDAMDIGDLVSRTLDRQAKSEIGNDE